MTVAPWPTNTGPCMFQTHTGAQVPQNDIDLESLHTVKSEPSRDEHKTEVSEIVFPKKIDIDSQKLLSSVCTKTQRAQTVCNTRKCCSGSKKRTLLRYNDAQIKKPEQFLTRSMDQSYSSRLSGSTSRALYGFPNLLSRFKLNAFTPGETTSTLHLDDSSSIPKLTIYQPKFM